MSSALKAIIFDVDGTLAETEELHRAAFNQAFAQAGLPWRWDERLYGALLKVTGGKERIRHFMDAHDAGGVTIHADQIARLHASKNRLYAQHLSHAKIALRPGIGALIEGARARDIALAIATTTSRSNVKALLSNIFGAEGRAMFSAIVCGEDVAHKKPAPDVYMKALAQLGLAACDCIAVEDSRNGLLAAKAAGLRVAVTPAFYTGCEDFSAADWLFGPQGVNARQLLD